MASDQYWRSKLAWEPVSESPITIPYFELMDMSGQKIFDPETDLLPYAPGACLKTYRWTRPDSSLPPIFSVTVPAESPEYLV